jgi:hypothetical protein
MASTLALALQERSLLPGGILEFRHLVRGRHCGRAVGAPCIGAATPAALPRKFYDVVTQNRNADLVGLHVVLNHEFGCAELCGSPRRISCPARCLVMSLVRKNELGHWRAQS